MPRPLQQLFLALSVVCCALAVAGQASAKTVLELFTSQGCSSCPPADALFEKYVARDDVIALSFHVDYWDRLGWRDTFGDRAFTDRQRQYARSRGDSQVYTPQMVIDGRVHVNGSSASAIEAEISSAVSSPRQQVPVRLTLQGDRLSVEAGAGGLGAELVLALAQRSRTISIARGENTGRKIEYRNVVRVLKHIEKWQGNTVSIDLSDVPAGQMSMAVVMLQSGPGGPVLGAEAINLHAEKL